MQQEKIETYVTDFKNKAELLAAEVIYLKTPFELPEAASLVLKQAQSNKIALVPGEIAEKCNLSGYLSKMGYQVKESGLTEFAAAADAGISQFDLGIVETGTLVQNASSLDQRVVSMLPPLHIALLWTDKLVKNMASSLEIIRKEHAEIPAYLTFVSGPSRTADIERIMTLGVHGPGRLLVMVVSREGGDNE